jgi:NAD(P)-dependent dehydrogenase (short-subunit alcohol dehydrogenase family)
VVCVTGSARRVGRAIVLEFARQGANVVIHHHASPAEAECAAQEARSHGVQALIVAADQSDPASVTRMFDSMRDYYGRLDIMVNSAAGFQHIPLLDMSYDDWQGVMGVNLGGPFLCTQAAATLMIDAGSGGAIVNISDNSGLNPWSSRPAHSVSKAGVIMLTQVSALALAEHNIRVNCVVPGPVLQPAGKPDKDLDALARELPLGRIGTPEDIGRACVFLATNDFVTGTVMRVDGGEGLARRET